jgi:Leu/Phe-tRNA-protein transferase
MSSGITEPDDADSTKSDSMHQDYILLPKLHLFRSILIFENLHVKKSIKRHLHKYELRYGADFDRILERCLEIHGGGWLTPPLVDAIKKIRRHRLRGVCPTSFALYRDGKLIAGEFGVQAGRVYTSYSGYHDEDNAGTAQLILASRYLQENGFAFFDLGMPLDYKTDLGARDISPETFVALFRSAQN